MADGRKKRFSKRKWSISIQAKNAVGEVKDMKLSNVLYCPTFPQKVKYAKTPDKGSIVILDHEGGEIITSNRKYSQW